MNAAALLKNHKVAIGVAVAAVVLVLVAGKQIKKLLAGAGRALDAATDGIANVIVDATHDPVQFAGGAYFLLPNGGRITPDKVTHMGAGRFRYLGTTYELVESLGGGSYRARKVS